MCEVQSPSEIVLCLAVLLGYVSEMQQYHGTLNGTLQLSELDHHAVMLTLALLAVKSALSCGCTDGDQILWFYVSDHVYQTVFPREELQLVPYTEEEQEGDAMTYLLLPAGEAFMF